MHLISIASCLVAAANLSYAFTFAPCTRRGIFITPPSTSSSLATNYRMVVKMQTDDVAPPIPPASAVALTTTATTKPFSLWETYVKTMDVLTTLFPLWTILFAGLALKRPESFAWFITKYFTASLGALMLSMGITLTPEDFTRVAKEPSFVVIGFLLCYVLCPALGLVLGKAFKLPVDLIAGLILVGSINGGQASNLCTYIARGDVALSGNTEL